MKTKLLSLRVLRVALALLVSSFCFTANAAITDVKLSLLQELPLSSANINGSNNSSNQLTPGRWIAYRTNSYLFGLMEIVEYGYNLKINWVTYNTDGTVHSQGSNLVIGGTWLADLDQGAQVSDASTADFWWEQVDGTIRYLVPQNGAQFYVVPDNSCLVSLNSLSAFVPNVIAGYELTSANINGSNNTSNQIPAGTKVLYQTNEGRYGIFEVVQYGYNLVLKWITFKTGTNQIYSSGCSLLVRGTFLADLDAGVESQAGADFWWEQVDGTIRYIVPQNGAKFFVLPKSSCRDLLAPLGSFTVSKIKNYQFSSATINGSDNANNKIPAGTKVLYITSEGRYGIFEVVQYGYNLQLKYITYNADGTIHSEGCNLVVRGTYEADLDAGVEGSASADFWWEQVDGTVRYLVPENKAKFFVLPSSDCRTSLGSISSFTMDKIAKYELSSANINGSDNASNQIPVGTKVLYKTSEGRFGIFEVTQYGYNLMVKWITYSSGGAIHSEGCDFVIRGTYLVDLDAGLETSTGADLWWEQVDGTVRYIVPQNGAQFFVLPTNDCRTSLESIKSYKPSVISKYELSSASINGSNNTDNRIPVGTKVLYKTSEGRLGVFEVVQYGYNLQLKWITYSAAGTIHSEGCSLIVRGTYLADLDEGVETSRGADFWWEQVDGTVRYIVPQNGAQFFVLPSSSCLSSLGVLLTYTPRQIASYPLSSANINGSNNSENRIPVGTKVAYKTSEGRYGVFQVVQYGYNLIVKWVTYNADGTIHSEGCNLRIQGTYLADLDAGLQTSTSADFWWEQVDNTVRYIVPQNGALFYVIPPADLREAAAGDYTTPADIQAAAPAKAVLYPVPAKDQLFLQSDNMTITAVKVYTANGALVKDISNPSGVINISELTSGLYTMQYFNGERWITDKFVKE